MKKLHHGEYVHMDVLPIGDLRITLTPEGWKEVLTNRSATASDDAVMYDLIEDIDQNSGLVFTTADKVPGNLSEAPMILEDGEYIGNEFMDYEWSPVAETRIWYWNMYQIKSILQEIMDHQYCDLTLLR